MGYIGSHTAVTLIEAGHEVVLFDNLSNSDTSVLGRLEKILNKKITFIEGDTAISYAKPDLANKALHWKTKRSIESMCESAWKFNESNLA